MNASTERVDPALAAGNRKQLAGYRATHFKWEVKEGVATVTLNRPERKNPLTFDSYAELRDLFRALNYACLLYTSPSPRDGLLSRMPSSA